MSIDYFTVNCLSYEKILKKSGLTEFYEKLKSLKDGDHRKLYFLVTLFGHDFLILRACHERFQVGNRFS